MAAEQTHESPDAIQERMTEVYTEMDTISQGARLALSRNFDNLVDISERFDLTPRQVAAAIGGTVASLSLAAVGRNPYDDVGLATFMDFYITAVNCALATMRIKLGWTPNGQS